MTSSRHKHSRVFGNLDYRARNKYQPALAVFIGGWECHVQAGHISIGCISHPVQWWTNRRRVVREFREKNERFDPRDYGRMRRNGVARPLAITRATKQMTDDLIQDWDDFGAIIIDLANAMQARRDRDGPPPLPPWMDGHEFDWLNDESDPEPDPEIEDLEPGEVSQPSRREV